MGVKRLSRGKLFNTEKEGINVLDNIGASALMKNCIISATQHREGHKVITDILVDLGSSKQELISGGDESAEHDVIGSGSVAAYVCELAPAVFGTVITSIETVCLEKPVGSGGALTGANAFKLIYGDADGVLNGPASSRADIETQIGVNLGQHDLFEHDQMSTITGKYVYFALGSQAGTDVATATATITVTETDVGNLEDEVSRITLTNAAGTLVHFLADTNNNDFDGTVVANKVQLKAATSAVEIAQGIARGINNHGNFTVSPVDGSSATLTVTQSAAGENGNQTNFFTDSPGKTAGISVGNFTGGTTKGDALPITAGKFLLRFTGFVAPDDL